MKLAARLPLILSLFGFGTWDGLLAVYAQTSCAPLSAWQTSYGGTSTDTVGKLKPTADGGYILGASSTSSPSGNKTADTYGEADFWLIKLNAVGEMVWEKSYGGSQDDSLTDLLQTADGGYILVGSSYSPPSGNKTSPAFSESYDGWVVRVDAMGEKLWDHSYGGLQQDAFTAIQPLTNGDYILAGHSFSVPGGTKTSTNYGSSDMWAVRINAMGQQLWDASYGGTEADGAASIVVMPNGNILLGGMSSFGGGGTKTDGSYGDSDYWLVMIDPTGIQLWDRSYGGIHADYVTQLLLASDGNVVVGGSSYSYASGNKQSETYGGYDFWLLRLDPLGNKRSEQAFGGRDDDMFGSMAVLPDGGLVICGASRSATGPIKTSRNRGEDDVWVIRLGTDEQKVWDQSFGGTGVDGLYSSLAVSTLGHIVIASASYSSTNGNKTAPAYGDSDLWILELAPENDCDLDGVLNDLDLCPETPLHTTVNTNGCTIEQLCPCDGIYESKDAYLSCVSNTVAAFVASGLLTPAEATNVFAAAVASPCPIIHEARIFFGLTNSLSGDATFTENSVSFSGPAQVLTPNYSGTDGLVVYLGQAEGGLFIRPDAPVWGEYNGDWQLTENAYGSRDGVLHSLLATISARKPDYEVYPVTIDFSPLGAESLTFEVYSESNSLVSSVTTTGAIETITIHSSTYLGPRVNPIWRWSDGSIGALIEFLAADPAAADARFEIGDHGQINPGRKVFVRANNPTRRVDYVSRVEVHAAGGLSGFTFLDEQVGVFRRPHKAVGETTLHPRPAELTVRGLAEMAQDPFGVLIELNSDQRFDLFLEPMFLSNVNDLVTFFLNGRIYENTSETFGSVQLRNHSGALELTADFSVFFGGSGTTTEPEIGYDVKIYYDGRLSGTVVSSNGAPAGTITSAEVTDLPALRSVGGQIRVSNHQPEFALTFDRRITFTDNNGNSFLGNHLRCNTVAPLNMLTGLSAASLLENGVPSYKIIGEHNSLLAPVLTIRRLESEIVLSWPLRNQPYTLEGSADVLGAYESVEVHVTLVENTYHVTLPVTPDSHRFFRLRSPVE